MSEVWSTVPSLAFRNFFDHRLLPSMSVLVL
jgi:hypothetical protein